MNASPVAPSRRYDYVWLRVLLILAVFVFHSIHFFDPGYWHVKNATTYLSAAILMTFISRWLMPAIFIVSGVATFYALGKRGAGVFIKERTLRLLVPLVIGCFTHAAWQVYLERLNHKQFSGSFWQYYLTYFTRQSGNKNSKTGKAGFIIDVRRRIMPEQQQDQPGG